MYKWLELPRLAPLQTVWLSVMVKCKVRDGFFVHLGEDKIANPGTILDLTLEEFSRFAHQLELVESSNKESKRESKVQS